MGRRSVLTLAVASAAFLLGMSVSYASRALGDPDAWKSDIAIESVLFAKTKDHHFRVHGVAVCTLNVSNISAVTHKVRLSANGTAYRQECTLEPGASAPVCFKFLPGGYHHIGTLNVDIDGTAKGYFNLGNFPYRFYAGEKHLIILSPSISQTAVKYRAENLPVVLNPGSTRKSSGTLENVLFLEGQVPVTEWPAQWLHYTPADCIVLTKDEWETAPPGVRNALLGFLQAGGCLILAGASDADVARYAIPVGFGTVNTISAPVPEKWTEKDIDVLRTSVFLSASLWQKFRPSTEWFFTAPRLLPVYLLLFCIMIFLGPVLLVILAIRNMRIRIYWLAPGIAIAVSIVILVFALIRDGISPITHAQSVLYLNGKSRTQVLFTTLNIMAPAGLSTPLRFGPSVEVMPAGLGSGNGTVRNGDELVLGSGWVSARIPATFRLRDTGTQSVPMLSFDASAKVANPYPVTIQRLLYYDAKGNCFTLDKPLAPGAAASLVSFPSGTATTMRHVVELVKRTFYRAESFNNLCVTDLALSLPPNTYLCEFEGTPFLEHPLRKGKIRHTGQTLMLGELP